MSFRCRSLWSSIYQRAKVKWGENPTSNEWGVREAESNVAAYVYRVQRTLEIETFLKSGTDAQALANSYIELVETPALIVEFSVAAAKGIGLMPWQKIKITRQRALGGALVGVLYRILEIKFEPLSGIVHVRAQLDTQTY